jgi:hypothetical protein
MLIGSIISQKSYRSSPITQFLKNTPHRIPLCRSRYLEFHSKVKSFSFQQASRIAPPNEVFNCLLQPFHFLVGQAPKMDCEAAHFAFHAHVRPSPSQLCVNSVEELVGSRIGFPHPPSAVRKKPLTSMTPPNFSA